MRLAVSGTHQVGKTTLAERLTSVLPGYGLIPEPFLSMADEGYEFAEMPLLEEFEAQLERAIDDAATAPDDTVFDRCPLDLLGYLTTHQDHSRFDIDRWLHPIRAALADLDLIIFLPIEPHDRIVVPRAERRLRSTVDEALRAIIVQDQYGFGVKAVEVAGPLDFRLRRVLHALERFDPRED